MSLRSLVVLAPLLLLGSCGGGEREFIAVGTAPIGGAFYTVGSAI